MQTFQLIKQFIKDDLASDVDLGDLDENKPLLESGIIDSLGILKLIAFMEKQFGIRVEDEELIPENFETLLAICSMVARKNGHSS